MQIILAQRKDYRGVGRKSDYKNSFRGICKCELCKKGVVLRHQKGKHPYLICDLARHGSCDNHVYFPYDLLEKFVFENHMKLWNIRKRLLKLTPEPKNITSRIPELDNELADLRMKRGRLVERFAEGDPDADRLIADYDTKIQAKQKELEALRHDELIARHGDDFNERWNQAQEKLATGDNDARAKMATLLRERIVSVVLTPRRTVILAVSNGRRNSAIIRLEISAALGVNVLEDRDTYYNTWIEWQRLEHPNDPNIEPWTKITPA